MPIFYNVIQKYAAHSVSIIIENDDLIRAKERIWSNNVNLIFFPNTEIKNHIFNLLVESPFKQCYEIDPIRRWVSENGEIDLYVDDDTISDTALGEWEDIIGLLPDGARDIVGQKARFVSDEILLPLQAADFWAWWVRRDREEPERYDIRKGDFGSWKGGIIRGFSVTMNEDQIVEYFLNAFRKGSVAPGLGNIYDSKVRPRDHSAISPVGFSKNASYYRHMQNLIKWVKKPRF